MRSDVLLHDLRGAVQRLLNVAADILRSNLLHEDVLMDDARGMFLGSAQQQVASGGFEPGVEIFDGAQSRGVDGAHAAQPQDDDRRQGFHAMENDFELLRGPEQQRSLHAEDFDVLGNVLVVQQVQANGAHEILGHRRNRSGFGHAADEGERRKDHAELDRRGQVGHHGEPEGDQPHRNRGLGELQQAHRFRPLSHVVADDHEDGSQHGHGNVARQRRGK